jgi:tRNA dimethylallyltransferase
MGKREKVLSIVGPTATGKSDLAVSLAGKLDGEIISADSMQVYQSLCIGTAVPDIDARSNIPHHLLQVLDPGQLFSVAEYVQMADASIREIHGARKLPILVGGTGLYIRAVLYGLNIVEKYPAIDGGRKAQIRRKLEQYLNQHGQGRLFEWLNQLDPISAGKLHPNDTRRVIRALEIYYGTGKPMSEVMSSERFTQPRYNSFTIGLNFLKREQLYRRIDERVDRMLKKGLLEEARWVYEQSFPSESTVLQAIGYKEFFPFFDGFISYDQAVESVKRNTRRYAKRQLTWFRAQPDVHWIEMDESTSIKNLTQYSLELLKSDFLLHSGNAYRIGYSGRA